ncbi:MAG: hypothetical protein GVY36_12525 [Verrucomicrobia bacterium]|jgi:competence protein ComEC|nr:hypothetical protein [Verrucomicrobiota bacterium]
MVSQKQSSPRAPALSLLVSVIIGFCISRAAEAPAWITLGSALVLGVFSAKIALTRPHLWLFCFFAAATLSAWTYASWRLPSPPGHKEIDLPVREATLHFEVTQVMQARTAYGGASGLGRVLQADATSRLAEGDRIYFRLKLPGAEPTELLRGSTIRAVGLIKAIQPDTQRNTFDTYLIDTGVYHRFTRGRQFEQTKAPSHFEAFCQRMNKRFESYLRLGSPGSGDLPRIYVAMLLGQKAALTPEQNERFRTSGTMHFFAISGLHIGVIATVLAQFLLLMRVPRKISPFIGLPLLYLYVEITGASPSAVRAFLMALFFWLSFALCRQRSPLAALAASAVFVLIIAPGQLWSLGFQLSYTVVLSILLFGLPLYEQASQRLAPFTLLPESNWSLWHRFYASSQDAVFLLFSISFSAWLASAPLSAAFFGYFSPLAIILNILLVNLVAVAIITGVISLALALVGLPFLAEFINHAAWLTIAVMDRLVTASTGMPMHVISTPDFHKGTAYTVLTIYFILLALIQRNRDRLNQNVLILAAPPAVIIIGLLWGLA